MIFQIQPAKIIISTNVIEKVDAKNRYVLKIFSTFENQIPAYDETENIKPSYP